MKRALLGIDLQIDFCNPEGALYVNGADRDVANINHWIKKNIDRIDDIILSMDSHQPIHIAHQIYWKNKKGEFPALFSTISYDDVINGKWIPQYNSEKVEDYLKNLEEGGDVCTIWPPHCIIGKKGWGLNEDIFSAIEEWSIKTGKSYKMVNKGMTQFTEHYSIFKAAVEYQEEDVTLFNDELLAQLNSYDQVFIVGEAADFCVANSLKDLLAACPAIGRKLYMLTDCMSYIIPDNPKAKEIFDTAKQLGVTFCKSTDLQ